MLVGTGRMGDIRAKLMYGNPKIDFCGVVDLNTTVAEALAAKYSVSQVVRYSSLEKNCIQVDFSTAFCFGRPKPSAA